MGNEEEDTSEKGTVEEEESTGTSTEESEEEKEEETSSESKEDNSSEEGEGKVEQYIDLDKVPANLKDSAKRMLASHTKAMQKVQSDYKKLEEHLGTKYSQAIIKSKALEQLANNPNFQLLISDIESGKPYGYSSTFNTRNGRDKSEDTEGEEEGTSTKVDMKKITAAVNKAVREAVRPIYDREAQNSWEHARKTFPDFDKYKPDITAAIQRFPDMSLEEAYEFVSRKDAVTLAKREITSKTKEDVDKLRSKPRTEKSSSGGGSGVLNSKVAKTVKEAIEFAISQQK